MKRKTEKIDKEDFNFWKELGIKSITMVGFTYFSVAVALQSFTIITPSILSGGLYFFTELTKYYGFEVKKKNHKFLI